MRTIAEAAEDIKSILNNIERTQECYGETLCDINELIDEILSIDSKEREETNAAKELFNKTYRDNCFSEKEIKLFEAIENALGYKLYFWQKAFLITGHFRQTGETTAICLKRLLGNTPIDLSRPAKNKKEHCERHQLMQINNKLQHAGIATAPIFTRQKDVLDYKEQARFAKTLILDEMHTKNAFKYFDGEGEQWKD